ncbi:metal-sensing transcriptional repressor [Candidatus Dojkabacteria bacterium]|uniref:Metal-sensing transcriptional repressor n=1 Tax=Candidatus Dojkabacteria bacterium TaxID=2099670 RepID=A0A955I8M6_9BACT|nr:metal-sensing transcriptional repressor [Candidatus Dojkabacteria bacterium]
MKQDKRFKTTPKDKALHRIKIIQGHLKAVEKMLQDDQYCVDIVHQSRAVQKALKNLDLLLIENHLKTCVVNQIHNHEEKRTTEELLKLFEYK